VALLFTAASSQYLKLSAGLVSNYPLTISCWFYSSDDANAQDLCSLTIEGSGNNWLALLFLGGNVGGDPVRAGVKDTSFSAANSSTGYTTNTWTHAAGVWRATNDRSAYINGGNRGNDTNLRSPSAPDTTGIGARIESSVGSFMSGRIAELAIWRVDLADWEIARLGEGRSPLFIRPQSLVWYSTLRTDARTLSGSHLFTSINGHTLAEHPSIHYPTITLQQQFFVKAPAPAAGRTTKNTDIRPLGVHSGISRMISGNTTP
jgi:hypothetical protein